MIKYSLIFILLFWASSPTRAQTSGCTDPLAKNYDLSARTNNGSCVYENSNISPIASYNLSSALVESSGLIYWNDQIWTINDSDDINLYALNPADGSIIKSYPLTGHKNKDWEEISQDENYIYVGDFGNNSKGNRDKLKILKIEKNSLLANSPEVATIHFSYSNQTDFSDKGHNNTDFDCESFIVSRDSIYLFTKQWVSKKTSIYKLPKTQGTHIAELKDTYDVNGLITGATYLEDKKMMALCGYSSTLSPFIYLFYDFKDKDFFGGNKRKLNVSLPFHQIEGIATNDGLHFYLSNEYISKPIVGTTLQQLHLIDLSNWLWPYTDGLKISDNNIDFSVYPNPAKNTLTIVSKHYPSKYFLLNSSGQIVKNGEINEKNTSIDIKSLSRGTYFLKVDSENGQKLKIVKK